MSASAGLPEGRDTIASPLGGLIPSADPPYEGWRRPDPGPTGRRADLIAAAALCVAAVLTLPLYPWAGVSSPTDAPIWLELVWSALLCVPLVWRRRHPWQVVLVVSAVFIAGGIAFGSSMFFHNIALFVAFYSVGAWEPHRSRARWVRIVITAAMLIWLLVSIFVYATSHPGDQPVQTGPFSPLVSLAMIQLLTNIVFFAAGYALGDRSFAHAVQQDELDRRNAELTRERERSTAQALTLERVRIARELHDVVAHHVSMMGVQAGAARLAIGQDPQTAGQALHHVEDSARTAIEELRGILTTLRETEPGTDPTTESAQPTDPSATVGTRRLPELIDITNTAGLPTRLEVIGTPATLPATTDVNLYRIAQEALTNARKHAGPRATVDVRLRYYPDEVEIEIVNSGSSGTWDRRRSIGAHLGQQGMRERAAASGGTIEYGPLQRGGYLVRARLPLPQRSDHQRSGHQRSGHQRSDKEIDNGGSAAGLPIDPRPSEVAR